MQSDKVRKAYTAPSFDIFSTWYSSQHTYSTLLINAGTNPMSKLEIVSLINTFNLAFEMFAYHNQNRTKRFYPKVYFGTVQTASTYWNYDVQGNENLDQTRGEKSGSWLA